jgi:UDPglucose 6-dehydrogenase
MKKIVVIGAGYVGLVTATCLAQKNNLVTVVENDEAKVNKLHQGILPFFEKNLLPLFLAAQKNKCLIVTSNLPQAIATKPDIIFICVGTPAQEDGATDLSFVKAAVVTIGTYLCASTLIVTKSTVPVGTTLLVKQLIEQELAKRMSTIAIDVASNPEFLSQGNAVENFNHPHRIIIGTSTHHAQQTLYELYQPFIKQKKQFLSLSIPSAELCKYAANTMLATRISFMNQLARLADATGADILDIEVGIGLDQRIGKSFLKAGLGYGGSCFPKDIQSLIHMGKIHKVPMTLAQEVNDINKSQLNYFISLIQKHYPTLLGKKVGIWGASYKPETDDMRDAPSLGIMQWLLTQKASIVLYDPAAAAKIPTNLAEHITAVTSKEEVLLQADCLLVLTEWKEFVSCPLNLFTQLADKIIFDGRNCLNKKALRRLGLTYLCIGRNDTATLAESRTKKTVRKEQCL